jgi:abortive infection bacteriophage resistance protein
LINANDAVDGYDIVKDYAAKYSYSYTKSLKRFKNSRYQQDMYEKRKDDVPIWALMEHMDFSC